MQSVSKFKLNGGLKRIVSTLICVMMVLATFPMHMLKNTVSAAGGDPINLTLGDNKDTGKEVGNGSEVKNWMNADSTSKGALADANAVQSAGDINITLNDEFSPVSNIKIALNSKLISSSAINNSVANVTATIRNVGDVNIEFDEVYAGNGDLYFKIDGATSAIENSGILYLLNLANQVPNVVDCGEDAVCQTTEIKELTCTEGEECNLTEIDDTELNILDGGQNVLDEDTIAYFASLIDIVEVIDGEWLKVSVDELNMLSGGMTASSDISCVTNLVSDINTNSNSAIELYSKYPFISSTNKDVKLASKNYPVYQISVDSEKFANFVNSIQNSEMTANLYSCLGWADNVSVSKDDVAKMVNTMPKIYAEVDGENNFTRLYLTSDLNNGEGTMTIDLGFSYPTNVNVPEPEEYKNFSDVIQEIMSSMYSLPAGA